MKLSIGTKDAEGRRAWQLQYGMGEEADIRSYHLIEVDTAQGHYQIDENNSIILDANLNGNTLTERFSVMNSLLTITHRLEQDRLIFEVVAGKETPSDSTGGEGEVPYVKNYAISSFQRAILTKALTVESDD